MHEAMSKFDPTPGVVSNEVVLDTSCRGKISPQMTRCPLSFADTF